MKFRQLLGSLLLIAILLWGTSGCQGPYPEKRIFHRIQDFRQHRLGQAEQSPSFSLVAVGDIMLSRYVAQVSREKADPAYSLAGVKWFWQDSQLVFGNLENPLTPGEEIKIHGMKLRADPEMGAVLKEAGFDLLSLANNHFADWGTQGMVDTMDYLAEAGLQYVGAGKDQKEAYTAKYFTLEGTKVGVLAFNDPAIKTITGETGTPFGPALLSTEKLANAVQEAAHEADFLMVYLHIGREYSPEPDDRQRYFAHLAIDHGADLVIGSHPHVIQPVEKYRGKYIFHSLGNFIFDQFWSRETREGIIVKFHIKNSELEKISLLPFYIHDDTRPLPLTGDEAWSAVEKLGLELTNELIPAWDHERHSFTAGEAFVLELAKPFPQYRLKQYRETDLDGDGVPERINLENGLLTVYSNSQELWRSPREWWVDWFLVGDITNDGTIELAFSLWKEGNFGPYKPFWLEDEDTEVKNHLFVFKLTDKGFRSVWQSSNLDYPNYQGQLVDLNGDGQWEILVLEGDYLDPNHQQLALWQWNGWGFTLLAPEQTSFPGN